MICLLKIQPVIREDSEMPESGLSGSESGIKPRHQVTETTHLCINKDYDGDVYLNLYLIARR